MANRWPIQVAVIALGAVVAAGTLYRPLFSPSGSLVERMAARDTVARQKMSSLVAAVNPNNKTGLGSTIDHPSIDKWVTRLSTTMASGFSKELASMSKYADMITTKLAAKEMPKDLIYLAMIESGFNPNAKSRVAAVGMWQFMKPTAKQYGLAVGKKVDERKNPARSTDAALKYLSNLHDRLGSWYLAAAAYNSGEGTVLRALKKVTGKTTGTDDDFFKIMPVLPKETQDYVPKLIATARIGNAPLAYGISSSKTATGTGSSTSVKRAKPPSRSRTIASAPRDRKAATQ